MRLVRIIASVFAVYVVLGLTIDSAIGYFQPQGQGTAVLRTFDADGRAQERVLGLLDDDGQLWVESGHWFRGWYHRVRENPNVELIRDGETRPYRAVPLFTAEAQDRVIGLMKQGAGNYGYWAGRTMLLFAPIKPVRLDPRDAS